MVWVWIDCEQTFDWDWFLPTSVVLVWAGSGALPTLVVHDYTWSGTFPTLVVPICTAFCQLWLCLSGLDLELCHLWLRLSVWILSFAKLGYVCVDYIETGLVFTFVFHSLKNQVWIYKFEFSQICTWTCLIFQVWSLHSSCICYGYKVSVWKMLQKFWAYCKNGIILWKFLCLNFNFIHDQIVVLHVFYLPQLLSN